MTNAQRNALVLASVDAIFDDIERNARRRQSFEYLNDPDDLAVRRGQITGTRVA